jgi:hypothetical protein
VKRGMKWNRTCADKERFGEDMFYMLAGASSCAACIPGTYSGFSGACRLFYVVITFDADGA